MLVSHLVYGYPLCSEYPGISISEPHLMEQGAPNGKVHGGF